MAEWSQGDKMTVALMNQKTVYVGSGAPTTKYDGQVWVCVSSNPPLLQSYDLTNTNWLKYGESRYETVVSGQLPASGVYLDGALCTAYDTEQSSAKLYAYANGSWRNMGGTLTRTYPIGNTIKTATETPYDTGAILSGQSKNVINSWIAVTNSGDYLVCTVGGDWDAADFGTPYLEVWADGLKIGSANISAGGLVVLVSGRVSRSAGGIFVSSVVYSATSSSRIKHNGLTLGLISITT